MALLNEALGLWLLSVAGDFCFASPSWLYQRTLRIPSFLSTCLIIMALQQQIKTRQLELLPVHEFNINFSAAGL
jgi:hypothetical protein